MFLLVEYKEGYFKPAEPGHITCSTVEDDYYFPIVLCETKEEIFTWVQQRQKPGTVLLNGDTITVEKTNWRGEPKVTEIYYMVPVKLGEIIVY
jgi:hypothetical protein